jgi:hypothetical protein
MIVHLDQNIMHTEDLLTELKKNILVFKIPSYGRQSDPPLAKGTSEESENE